MQDLLQSGSSWLQILAVGRKIFPVTKQTESLLTAENWDAKKGKCTDRSIKIDDVMKIMNKLKHLILTKPASTADPLK